VPRSRTRRRAGLRAVRPPAEIAYAKELELRISRSYGPAATTPRSRKGARLSDRLRALDRDAQPRVVPRGVADRRVAVAPLVTHRYAIDEAPRLRRARRGNGARRSGIVIRYDDGRRGAAPRAPAPRVAPRAVSGGIGVAFVGAGAFARADAAPAASTGRRLARAASSPRTA
jgi:hypothetical protein